MSDGLDRRRIYTHAYFGQQQKMAEAKQVILSAMYAFTASQGEFTTLEWATIFNEQVTRMLVMELSDDGEGDKQQ